MAARSQAEVVCLYCHKPICGEELRRAVVLQNGHMHGDCQKRMRKDVDELFERAIREGRHRATG